MGSLVGLCDLTAASRRHNNLNNNSSVAFNNNNNYNLNNTAATPAAPRNNKNKKKKTSFSTARVFTEPFLRPDSPTSSSSTDTRAARMATNCPPSPPPPPDGDAGGILSACLDGDEFTLRRVMVRQKLSSGVINSCDVTGKTALSHVCNSGNMTLLELLLLVPSIDPNLADNEGNTPLHFAAQAGHHEVITRLLACFKALAVDLRNNVGMTALMKAALQGKTKCVRLLLNAGSSPVLRDPNRGLCAHEWASFCGRHQTARVIECFMKMHKIKIQLPEERWASEPDLTLPLSPDTTSSAINSACQQHPQPLVVVESNDSPQFLQRIKRVFRNLDFRKNQFNMARNLSGTVLCATSAPLVADMAMHKMPRPASAAADLHALALPKVKISLSNTLAESCEDFSTSDQR